jgi:hypothetical protein
MSAKNLCPICDYELDDKAVTVTVAGKDHKVCCDDCAKEARAHPEKLR